MCLNQKLALHRIQLVFSSHQLTFFDLVKARHVHWKAEGSVSEVYLFIILSMVFIVSQQFDSKSSKVLCTFMVRQHATWIQRLLTYNRIHKVLLQTQSSPNCRSTVTAALKVTKRDIPHFRQWTTMYGQQDQRVPAHPLDPKIQGMDRSKAIAVSEALC